MMPTLHSVIQSLRADNQSLREDNQHLREDIKNLCNVMTTVNGDIRKILLHIIMEEGLAGREGGASGAEESAPASASCPSIAMMTEPSNKKHRRRRRRRRRRMQKKESSNVTHDELWGGTTTTGPRILEVAFAFMILLFVAVSACALGIIGERKLSPRTRKDRAAPPNNGSEMLTKVVREDTPKNHLNSIYYSIDMKETHNNGMDVSLRNLQGESSQVSSNMFVCIPDPENCGCSTLDQSDYRGTINTTKDGRACARWDDANLNKFRKGFVLEYPDAGLEGNNFCRNPDNWYGTYCYTGATVFDSGGDWSWGDCDVPVCNFTSTPVLSPSLSGHPTFSLRPTSSLIPTHTKQPTIIVPSSSPSLTPSASSELCNHADKSNCGCEIFLQSDYRGTISTAEDGTMCLRWDAAWMNFTNEKVVSAGLYGNYCRNPFASPNGPGCYTSANIFGDDGLIKMSQCVAPTCDPCSCMPKCNEPNLSKCGCPSALQADECCVGHDSPCKCNYLKEACRISLNNNRTDFCDDAEVVCCSEKTDSNCICTMYEQMYFDTPSNATCEFAASSCCGSLSPYSGQTETCLCDFYTSSKNVHGYESEHMSGKCSRAEEVISVGGNDPIEAEKSALQSVFEHAGGNYWDNNTGWTEWSEVSMIPHCQWFGISCNDDGLVTKINLRNNNLTGKGSQIFYSLAGAFKELRVFDVAENKLTGDLYEDIYIGLIPTLLKLEHIDISNNYFSGDAYMRFSSHTSFVNFSHNQFTGFRFNRFNAAYETLKVVDLSNNIIRQNASIMFHNMPPNIQELLLSSNLINGNLPDPFLLEKLIKFDAADNNIVGTLPNFPDSSPLLRELDLSNQRGSSGEGLTGTIPEDIFKLVGLSTLNLAGNNLYGVIPSSIGNLPKLKVLNLSANSLSAQIPSVLGKLKDVLDTLDLSYNNLSGTIPLELEEFTGESIHLRNANMVYPAPLKLCFVRGFDLVNNTRFCPPERNALKEFYDSAKGSEWTVTTNWTNPLNEHCDWYGVNCNDANKTVKLTLGSNGLSGTLTSNIAKLRFLEVLDLTNNNIKGSIPTEIGELSNLTHLKLSYNEFIGNGLNIGNLNRLQLIHLHGNRLSGSINFTRLFLSEKHKSWESSYISDCGHPSDFNPSIACENCTMCCNNEAHCATVGMIIPLTSVTRSPILVWRFIACFIAGSYFLALTFIAYEKYRNRNIPRSPQVRRRSSMTERDLNFSLENIGERSVYQFFLGKSKWGWFIVIATMGAQIWILSVFVEGSKRDPSDGKADMVYTWQCTRDNETCFDTNGLNWRGWLGFTIMMLVHLLQDAITGMKLIKHSAKLRHGLNARIRLFIGGTLMSFIAVFSTYVSIIYNMAIATNNTQIIANSVIILFICDLDELMYEILTLFPLWVKHMSHEGKTESDECDSTRQDNALETKQLSMAPLCCVHADLESTVASLSKEVQLLIQKVRLIEEHTLEYRLQT